MRYAYGKLSEPSSAVNLPGSLGENKVADLVRLISCDKSVGLATSNLRSSGMVLGLEKLRNINMKL